MLFIETDLLPGLSTFVACLVLPLEIGILIGVGINVIFILYHAARPKISIENLKTQAGIEYLMITPDRCLMFPSVDYVRNLVNKHSMRQNVPVVIDGGYYFTIGIWILLNDIRLFAGYICMCVFVNLQIINGKIFTSSEAHTVTPMCSLHMVVYFYVCFRTFV